MLLVMRKSSEEQIIYIQKHKIIMKTTNTKHPSKELYSLTELLIQNLVPLKSRQLRARFKKIVSDKIAVHGMNLFRDRSSWQMYKLVIPLFNYKAIRSKNMIYPI